MHGVNRFSLARTLATFTVAVTVGVFFAPSAAIAAAPQVVHATQLAATTSAPPDTVNDFLPEDANLSTCIGMLERPGCSTDSKSDFRTYLTFAFLTLGLCFIGWRIAVGIRQRDRSNNKPTGNTF
jgi:hypothetical protein